VRLADALDPQLARKQIDAQLAALQRLVERSAGQIRAVIPNSIQDASDLPRLLSALRAHGFSDAMLRKFALENWTRIFKLIWH